MSTAPQLRRCATNGCVRYTTSPTSARCPEHVNPNAPKRTIRVTAEGSIIFGSRDPGLAIEMLRERLAEDRAAGVLLG